MAHRPLVSLILFGFSLAAFGTAVAQAPADASKNEAAAPAGTPAPAAPGSDSASPPTQSPAPSGTPSAPATSPPPAAPAGPSADTIKKARLAGFRPESRDGKTMFCQETANLGTRFPTKKCINEQQLQGVLDVQSQTHDSLRKPSTLDPALH